MGLGRRSAPTAPPVPSRPLPPSAYGIGVPGAPEVPAQQPFAPPPPPPSAPPAAVPSPFADFAPPTPPEPTIRYGAAPPSEQSASRFGGYAGPADAFAAPPAPQFGAGPVAYGTPTWSTQPPKKQGSRLWAKVLAGVFAALIGLGFMVRVYDAATKHHLATSMPTTIQDVTLDNSLQSQQAVAAAVAKVEQSDGAGQVQHFQAAIYKGGQHTVFTEMAEIPSNSSVFRDNLVDSFARGAQMTMSPVAAGKQGGSQSCGTTVLGAGCVWIDDGTVGFLFVLGADAPTAQSYLQTLRDQVEH